VFDVVGVRLDSAPIGLLSDYNPDSGAQVKTGLHCMRCHEVGVVLSGDQIRDTVLANPSNFEDPVVDQVMEWFPPAEVMEDIQIDDLATFLGSLVAIPVDLGEEPIWAFAEDYETPLTAVRVAAELGLAEGSLYARLETDEAIQVQYSSLYGGEGGTVDRDVFELAARDTICAIEAGDGCDPAAFCGLSAVPCPEGSVCDVLGQCSRL
jgi:hypothetical protein